jgi:radical SAM/Cys-rich protein
MQNAALGAIAFPPIRRSRLETLQVNLGYRCNQSCVHCHVDAGPRRTEEMARETVDLVIEFLGTRRVGILDITGGAPELNPHFRYLVERARDLDVRVIDRCNLTILEEAGYEDLDAFLAGHEVEITASLPCYQLENVDRQRGRGVFDASLRALRRLNRLGYGDPASGLQLNLVYNPQGPVLPPPQAALEADYRRVLGGQYGIRFNRLYTLCNMPIKRFGNTLARRGQLHDYLMLLQGAHQDANLDAVMCRTLVSVDWRGRLYDCDFNQMLGLPMRLADRRPAHLSDLLGLDPLGHPIAVGGHCYGCTAGQGSSCGGALR